MRLSSASLVLPSYHCQGHPLGTPMPDLAKRRQETGVQHHNLGWGSAPWWGPVLQRGRRSMMSGRQCGLPGIFGASTSPLSHLPAVGLRAGHLPYQDLLPTVFLYWGCGESKWIYRDYVLVAGLLCSCDVSHCLPCMYHCFTCITGVRLALDLCHLLGKRIFGWVYLLGSSYGGSNIFSVAFSFFPTPDKLERY